MQSDSLTLSTFLDDALRVSGLSNSQLARNVGVSPQAVDHWLHGGGRPRCELLPDIARTLQLEAHDERALYRLVGCYYEGPWHRPSPATQWPDLPTHYQNRTDAERKLRDYLLTPSEGEGMMTLVYGFLGDRKDRAGQCGGQRESGRSVLRRGGVDRPRRTVRPSAKLLFETMADVDGAYCAD